MSTFNVIIAGATGLAGVPITRAFLNPAYFPHQITSVKFTTRDANSPNAKALIVAGAQAIIVEGTPSAEIFKGADVFVSALGGFDQSHKDAYAKAAIEGGVKVYFPAVYGYDPRPMEIPHPIWTQPQAHVARAKELGKENGVKVICVFPGSFTDVIILGWGDIKDTLCKTWGNPNGKQTCTAIADLGASIVRLAILATTSPNSVPDFVRISGDVKSVNEIARIVTNVTGRPINVEVVGDPDDFKAMVLEKGVASANPLEFISWVAGTGVVDFTNDNDNELVNPGERFWKWTSVEEFVEANKDAIEL